MIKKCVIRCTNKMCYTLTTLFVSILTTVGIVFEACFAVKEVKDVTTEMKDKEYSFQ